MRGACRRIGIIALVIALVAQPMAMPAMAASTTPDDDGFAGDDCGRTFTEIAVDVFSGTFDESSKCEPQELVANATHGDIAASAIALDDLQSIAADSTLNRLEDARTVSKTIIKAEAAKALRNGSNLTVARQNINDSLESYYTPMQKNLLSSAQTLQVQVYYINQARNQSGLDSRFVGFNAVDDRNSPTRRNAKPFDFSYGEMANGSDTYDFYLQNETLTVADGSNFTVQLLHATDGTDVQTLDPTNQSAENGQYASSFALSVYRPTATPYVGNNWNHSIAINAYDGYTYRDAWLSIQEQQAEMKKKGAKYAADVYNTYNSSTFNGTKILDPITLSREFNTNVNTTGYYGWLAAELGTTGLEGNVNSSFEIAYTPRANHTPTNLTLNGNVTEYAFVNGTESNVSGTLMTDWAPASTNGTFQSGATYDTANTNKSVLFIEQVDSETSRIVNLNGTFTITSLTNVKTGNTVNETTLEEQNFQTFDPNSTEKELQNILDWREKAITINDAGGGGTGGGGLFDGFNFGSAGLGFIVIAGGGALLLLSNRS